MGLSRPIFRAKRRGSLRVASGWLSGCLTGWRYHMASGWPQGGLGVASGAVRDALPPVPPKTAKSRPQPPKSAIESHLRFAESFRVHGPISTSKFAAVSTPPPLNNSLRYMVQGWRNRGPEGSTVWGAKLGSDGSPRGGRRVKGQSRGTAWRVILQARPATLPSERAMNRISVFVTLLS